MAEPPAEQRTEMSLRDLCLYFLKLGTIGFGGPAALVGYMRKDLVDEGKRIDETTYNLSIALAQIMPGPLAAQTAIAIGYFQRGILGATLVGLAFILPSFSMVLGLSWLYVAYGGLPWMQSLFYGIGAVVTGIVLTFLFYVVFGVAGLILRLMRKDLLYREWAPAAASYWIPREQATLEKEHYTRQF